MLPRWSLTLACLSLVGCFAPWAFSGSLHGLHFWGGAPYPRSHTTRVLLLLLDFATSCCIAGLLHDLGGSSLQGIGLLQDFNLMLSKHMLRRTEL